MSKVQAQDLPSDGGSTDLPAGWTSAPLTHVCDLNPPKPPADEVPADTQVTFVPMPAVDAEAAQCGKSSFG